MLHKTSVSSYHHTDSLLFQFVLYEYMMALKQAAIIEAFSAEEFEGEAFFQKMTDYLMKMAGSEQEYSRIFSWIIDSGVLTKLKNYSDLLSERAEKSDLDFIRLHNSAHKAWVECLHTVDLIREHEQGHQNLKLLKESVKKTLSSIKKLNPVIKRIIPKYAQDENVLYFILRNKDSFDQSLGQDWTRRLLMKLHPTGLLLLMKRAFVGRGFETLVPSIAEAIEALRPRRQKEEIKS